MTIIQQGSEERDMFGGILDQNGAILSDCGAYRYHLWRVWNIESPIMVFVMCNPSTADAFEDDPTIRRCIGFAKREGYGGISVRNVFALRSTDPSALLSHPDPYGPENEQHLLSACSVSLMTRLICAWGVPVKGNRLRHYYQQAGTILQCQRPDCLGTTKQGHPRHPLYLPLDAAIEPFTFKLHPWGRK